jgi:UDP-glucose 4-epimerase
VTGGAGFIGSHVADRLAESGIARLIIVDDFFLGREGNLETVMTQVPVQIVRAGAEDLSTLQSIARQEEPDALITLATVPLPTSLEYPSFAVGKNVDLALASCELIRHGYVGKMIQISSSEVYGTARHVPMTEQHEREPITPYAASKAAADDILLSYCRTFDLEASILRPFNTYGPRQNKGAYAGVIPTVIERVKAGLPVQIHGDGLQTRDFVAVGDTAEAVIKALKVDLPRGTVANVSTGVETSILDLVGMILEQMNVPEHHIEHTSPRPGDVRRHSGDSSRLQELLGFRPTPISPRSLATTIEWFRSR